MSKIENENTKMHDESRQGEALLVSNKDNANGKKLYIESYGCAMNFSDSEVVASILTNDGFTTTNTVSCFNSGSTKCVCSVIIA